MRDKYLFLIPYCRAMKCLPDLNTVVARVVRSINSELSEMLEDFCWPKFGACTKQAELGSTAPLTPTKLKIVTNTS